MIFGEETSRPEILVRTVRSEEEVTDSETHRATKLDINKVTEVSVSSNKKPSARASAARKSNNLQSINNINNHDIRKKLYK